MKNQQIRAQNEIRKSYTHVTKANGIYWRPEGVRVRINGADYDLGKRSIECCEMAGQQLFLRVHTTGER